MTMCTRGTRRGAGALLALVMVLLGVLALAGGAAFVQRSGTGRTFARVVDGRLLLEAADAALAEAVVDMRRSADGAGALPGVCDDDWHAVLAGVFLTGAKRPVARVVRPLRARAVYGTEAPGLAIGDVRVDVVMAYPGMPAPTAMPRQGVLELAVRVEGERPVLGRTARVVRQRRIFYLTERTVKGAKGTPVPAFTFVLPPQPLGTVIE